MSSSVVVNSPELPGIVSVRPPPTHTTDPLRLEGGFFLVPGGLDWTTVQIFF